MVDKYSSIIKDYSKKVYKKIVKEPEGNIRFPFIVPGSNAYVKDLWDWDSWLTDIAIRQIINDNGIKDERFTEFSKGCVLNFFDSADENGRIPIVVTAEKDGGVDNIIGTDGNFHKPCLMQHAAFIVRENSGDAEWLRPHIKTAEKFIKYYMSRCKHEKTGLYFWINDAAIGVDNDPCTFYRPDGSSASVFLNCLMYKELKAYVYIAKMLEIPCAWAETECENLRKAIREHMWDERSGFYYSTDLNLKPINLTEKSHRNSPRHWDCLIQKIDIWSGFLAMWAEIATEEQAERMVKENMLNDNTFWAEYGIRSLSKLEKMYQIKKTENPSCWLGPIWGISNYICFKGLLKYGYINEAKMLAEKTICLFGKDIEMNGDMHEYYHPDTGEGVYHLGFQSWNLLVNNMIAWLEKRKYLEEY